MITKYIKTENGIYSYEPKQLQTGVKKIDSVIAFKLLTDVADVLDKHSIDYCLMFGTLLGAIREGGLIKHDEDMDIFIREFHFNRLINTLFELRDIGIDVVRHDNELLSLMRAGEYVDFYLFSGTTDNRLKCKNFVYQKVYFEEFISVNMNGKIFNVPKESASLLSIIYGDDWRTPKEGKHALTNSRAAKSYRYASKILGRILPVTIFKWLKKIVKIFQ